MTNSIICAMIKKKYDGSCYFIMMKQKIAAFLLTLMLIVVLVSCAKQVSSVSIDKQELEVVHGDNFILTATILPNDAENQSVAWSVDTKNVITVTDENTLQKEFKAAEIGTAKVKIITSNGKEATCSVTVTENEEDIAAREKAEEEAKIAAEKKAQEEKIAQEKAQEEARIAQEKEEQEAKKGYETGITFNQLARTPDEYKGKKVKFYGRVVQVLENDGETDLRVATKASSYGNYYDDVILVYYNSSIITSRVLEDDMITLYGVSMGLHTYDSTMGGKITVPLIAVDKIEIN